MFLRHIYIHEFRDGYVVMKISTCKYKCKVSSIRLIMNINTYELEDITKIVKLSTHGNKYKYSLMIIGHMTLQVHSAKNKT